MLFWAAFARKRHGDDTKPVLIRGVDMTKGFALMGYFTNGTHLSSRFTASDPLLAAISASAWRTWCIEGLIRISCDSQLCTPLPPSETLEPHPSDTTQVGDIPNQLDECVFIRYYTMSRRRSKFPKVMKAGYDSSEDPMTDYPSSPVDRDSDLELYHHVSSVWRVPLPPLLVLTSSFRRKEICMMTSRNMSSKWVLLILLDRRDC